MAIPRHILAASDFGAASDRALEVAATLAANLETRLTIVHVFEAAFPYPLPISPAFERDLRGQLDARCAAMEGRGLDVHAILREGAPAWSEIVSVAQETNADLIVVGMHGRHGAAQFLLGSVAERLIRAAPMPVLTVPVLR